MDCIDARDKGVVTPTKLETGIDLSSSSGVLQLR